MEDIKLLYENGQKYFGENYAQELEKKAQALGELDIEWSYIGHLQSNKIKKIVRFASEIQGLASLKHAKIIDQELSHLGKEGYPVYLSVNLGNEAGKSGVSLERVSELAENIGSACPNLDIQGVMAIPPASFNDDLGEVPQAYLALRQKASAIGKGLLSLGMTNDLNIAIAAGSNIVRIGTAIFGPRPI